jgi:hypothetical protein
MAKKKKKKAKLLEGKYKVLQTKRSFDKTKGKRVEKTSRMCEDVTTGKKYLKNHYEHEGPASSFDYKEAQMTKRGYYSSAGKGDWPRNVGEKFKKNYEDIDWGRSKEDKKRDKHGLRKPKRTKKVYK